MPAPANPRIYHITHADNLDKIIRAGCIWSDAFRAAEIDCKVVGMTAIKRRRLQELEVHCHAGTMVGEYVPFYFCPRSVMLYILHKGNHPDLTYWDGQDSIVHLVGDLRTTVAWADSAKRPWAFTKCNAGARYAQFFRDFQQLGNINWTAVESTDFRDPDTKEGKQAEFLVHQSFPWEQVEEIGVCNAEVGARVKGILAGARHRPAVSVRRNWYY